MCESEKPKNIKMKTNNCIKFNMEKLWLGAILFLCGTTIYAGLVPERYNVIVDRAPFGSVIRKAETTSNVPELTPEQIKLQEELAKEADLLGKNIKLTAITTFRGVPAAGIVEISSKRTYYLTKGQSILGYTLTDIGENSILLETTNAIANITMSYAAGQPQEITIHPTSGRLSVLNVFDAGIAATNSVVVKEQTPSKKTKEEKAIDGLNLSDEVREAVTIKDADGVERISFRELHRLRMEERKRKLEEERIAREEKEQAERKAKEEEAQRQEELRNAVEVVQESQADVEENVAMSPEMEQDALIDGFIAEEYSEFPEAVSDEIVAPGL